MMTYPNQKVIHINKKKYNGNFLQVGIEEWQEAFKELKPSSFAIYLYLASNADGFDLALSQKAVENALGIKKSAYHNAITELRDKGYITIIQGNVEAFNTTPQVHKNGLTNSTKMDSTNVESEVHKNGIGTPQKWNRESKIMDFELHKNNREIDNINKIKKIDNIDKASYEWERDCLIEQGYSVADAERMAMEIIMEG